MTIILRLPDLRRRIGRSRSSIYADIDRGTLPPPVRLTPRCVGWPDSEVEAILRARIAGHNDDEIRSLVASLVEARRAAA